MRTSFIIAAIALCFFAACESAEPGDYLASADSTEFAHNPAALTSPSRKIVKQADLKCRVKNIMNTVSAIEQFATDVTGLVSVSEIENRPLKKTVLRHTKDSLKEIHEYQPAAILKLRIPYMFLDTFLQALPSMVDFIEHRSIRQDDRTLAYLSNALKNKASVSTTKHEATKTIKPDNVADTFNQQLAVVDRQIENLQILDDVNYTRLSIKLSQPNQLYTAIIPYTEYAAAEPFFTRLSNNFLAGWEMLGNILVAMATLWPLILAMAAALWLYAIRKRKRAIAAR